MFSNTDQYTSATKAFFESQIAAFSALTTIATQGTEKIVALNMAAVKASADDSIAATRELLAAKEPQAFFSLVSALAKPNTEKFTAYNSHLTDILSSTKAEFTKIAEEQISEAQNKISAFVDNIAKNAPAGSENVIALMRSSVANAHAGYEQVNNAAKQAVQATEAHVAKASDEFTQVVKKTVAK